VGFKWLPGLLAVLIDVEPGEVMQMLEGGGRRWPRPATGPNGIPVLAILGRTKSGRPIAVYVRQDDGLDYTIIAGRPMSVIEQAEYEAWEAQ
jgi:hypothetical protein